MPSCSSSSTAKPSIKSCDSAKHNCLEVINYASEPVLLMSQDGAFCNVLAPYQKSYYDAEFTECFEAVGKNSGKKYVTDFCTIIDRRTMMVLDIPEAYSDYQCHNPWWFVLGAFGLILSIGATIWIVMLRKKIMMKACTKSFGDASLCTKDAAAGAGTPPLTIFGILATAFLALLSIALLAAGAVQTFLLETCSKCRKRSGGGWTWSPMWDNAIGRFFCSWLGLCICRSGIRERNCDIMSRTFRDAGYAYSQTRAASGKAPDKYNCACNNKSENVWFDCTAGGSPDDPCSACKP